MTDLDVLADEYPGDVAWHRFAAVVIAASRRETDGDPMTGDPDIDAVILAMMGRDRGARWFQEDIPALTGKSPAEVVRGMADGHKILRHLLMRMPQ